MPLAAAHRRPVFLATALLVYAGNFVIARQHGAPVPEWVVGIDVLLLLPALYVWLLRPAPRRAALGVLAVLSVGVLAGAWIIPPADKQLWLLLARLRWLVLGGLLLAQAVLMTRVVLALWRSRGAANQEEALHAALQRHLGDSVAARLMQLEARLWLYLLRRPPAGLARAHVLLCPARGQRQQPARLHGADRGGDPDRAWPVAPAGRPDLGLGLHRPQPLRPRLSVCRLARHAAAPHHAGSGAAAHPPWPAGDLRLPLAAIADAQRQRPPRAADGRRFIGAGRANVALRRQPGTRLPTLRGEREIRCIHLGVDEPERLLAALRAGSCKSGLSAGWL